MTSLISAENLEFTPSKELLIPDPSDGVSKRLRSIEEPPKVKFAQRDDEIQEYSDDQASTRDAQPHLLRPHDIDRYRLSPVPAGAVSPHTAWMIATTKKNNSLMRKIWRAISQIKPVFVFEDPRQQRIDAWSLL